jgi:hypothetical protein
MTWVPSAIHVCIHKVQACERYTMTTWLTFFIGEFEYQFNIIFIAQPFE